MAEPKGLNVETVTELRKKLREAKVEYRVVKNTLAARAAKGTPVEAIARSSRARRRSSCPTTTWSRRRRSSRSS